MRKLILLHLVLTFALCARAQESDSTKTEKRKNWTIELTPKQVAAVADIDYRINQLSTELAKLQEAKTQYVKAIVESKDIDVSKLTDFQYKDGKLIFVELKPRR